MILCDVIVNRWRVHLLHCVSVALLLRLCLYVRISTKLKVQLPHCNASPCVCTAFEWVQFGERNVITHSHSMHAGIVHEHGVTTGRSMVLPQGSPFQCDHACRGALGQPCMAAQEQSCMRNTWQDATEIGLVMPTYLPVSPIWQAVWLGCGSIGAHHV